MEDTHSQAAAFMVLHSQTAMEGVVLGIKNEILSKKFKPCILIIHLLAADEKDYQNLTHHSHSSTCFVGGIFSWWPGDAAY